MKYGLRGLTVLAVFICLSLSSGLLASAHSTKWRVQNDTKEALTLTCTNTAVTEINIVMTTPAVAPQGAEVFDWGDSYYNDGLWLNPGKWSCRAKERAADELTAFTTGWGEAVVLTLSDEGGHLHLAKRLDTAPIAKKAEGPSRKK